MNSLDRASPPSQSPAHTYPQSQQQQHQQHQHQAQTFSQTQDPSHHLPQQPRTNSPPNLAPGYNPSRPSSSVSSTSTHNVQSRYTQQSGAGEIYPSQYQSQQQAPLDEAFQYHREQQSSPFPIGRDASPAYSDRSSSQIRTSAPRQDVKSLYHLPSEPFDSSFSLAGLKSSPITELSPSGRALAPGPSAQNFFAATAAFAQTPSTNGQHRPLTMPLSQGSRSTDGSLNPTMSSFEPAGHARKTSFAIAIVSPTAKDAVQAGQEVVSPAASRNSSISSDDSAALRDPEESDDGKEEQVVFRSPNKKAPYPISVPPTGFTAAPAPGTPPRSATFSVPSIQTIAATPMKPRHSPTSNNIASHRRNDSFVGPDENDEASDHNGSPRKSRLSLGGSSGSLRQGSIASLGKKSSFSTINEDKHDKRTLWFGDLEPWMDDNYMRSVTSMCGWDIDNIKLIRPTVPTGVLEPASTMNAGYCFITFATQDEALRVLTIITPSATNAPVPMPNSSRNFRANWASGATVANPFTTATALPPTDGREYSVFVGDLAPAVTEEVLIQTFMNPPSNPDGSRIEGFSGVRGAKIMTDPVTGASKMYGFVRLSNEEEQQRALVEMQGVSCMARAMRISPATTRARTASGAVEPLPSNIARAVTPDYLLPGKTTGSSPSSTVPSGILRAPSPTPVSTIHRPIPTALAASSINPFAATYPSANLSGPSPGEIAIASDPALALNLMQIKVLAATPSAPLPNGPTVHHSVSFNDPNNTTVFVGGLSPLITEDMLRAFFISFGEIAKVTVPPGKKCGFVHFATKGDAEKSIEKLQGFPLAGTQLRLSWGKSSAPSTRTPSTFQQPQTAPQVAPASSHHMVSAPPNPLQAQILQMQQQLAALTAMANNQSTPLSANGNAYGGINNIYPGLPPTSTTSFSPATPTSAGGDPLAILARSDPLLFAQLVASNPAAFSGAYLNNLNVQPQQYVQAYDNSFAAQLQANQQQMMQLQAMQARLEEPQFGGVSPFSSALVDPAHRQHEANQFWAAKNVPAPGRSVSPFSQAAQAMAERASERNSGRSRHSTSPGEHVSYLAAPAAQQGGAEARRGSAAPRYVPPGQGFNGDFTNQTRSRTKSESVQQAFGGLAVSGGSGPRQGSWNGPAPVGKAPSFTDMAGRANSESPRALRRLGGSFSGV